MIILIEQDKILTDHKESSLTVPSKTEVNEKEIVFSRMLDLIERQRELNKEIDGLLKYNDPCWSAFHRMLDKDETKIYSSILDGFLDRIRSGIYDD